MKAFVRHGAARCAFALGMFCLVNEGVDPAMAQCASCLTLFSSIPCTQDATPGSDLFIGDGAANRFCGGAGDDSINGNGGDDVLQGGDGNDFVSGGTGNDLVLGGLGDDARGINGDAGDDRMNGGPGADNVNGGSGNDLYIIQFGHWPDTIMDSSGGADALWITGLSAADDAELAEVAYTRVSNDLRIALRSDDTTIATIRNFYTTGRIETFHFGNPAHADINIAPPPPPQCSSECLSVAFSDRPCNTPGTPGDDHFEGSGAGERFCGDLGDDVINGNGGDDALRGGDGDDQIDGGSGNDSLFGGDGDDVLDGDTGNDRLNGGPGVDMLSGSSGDDLYVIAPGEWPDTIQDSSGASDAIWITGVGSPNSASPRDVCYARQANDLVITVRADDALIVRVRNYYTTGRIERIHFGNSGAASPFVGDPPNNLPYGVLDAITTQVLGWAFDPNQTSDPIGVHVYADVLHFVGGTGTLVERDDVTLCEAPSDQAGFAYPIPDTLGLGVHQIDVFAIDAQEGSVLLELSPRLVYTGTPGPDVLVSDGRAESVLGFGGNDTITGGVEGEFISGGDGNDVIGGGAGDDSLHGNIGQDVVSGGAGNDVIGGGDDNDILNGGSGDDTLSGGPGDDQLRGGLDDDLLAGGDGNDNYYYASGHGNDVVDDGAGSNVLYLEMICPRDVSLRDGPGGSLYVDVDNGATLDRITILHPDAVAVRFTPNEICGDFNCNGSVNSQDFFDFNAAFFSEAPSADFNRDSRINSQDFFDFVSAFFGGCG